MRPVLIAMLMCLLVSGRVCAADGEWLGSDGVPAADTDARKSANGFGGWIAATADPDWQARWENPGADGPSFNESRAVRRGERLTVLIFILNPALDSVGVANVRCDLRVTRPDGTHPVDAADVTCLQGELQGPPANIRVAAPVINFVGEPADQLGTWTVEVTLKDAVRDTTLALKTAFELKE
jgi:hypothetical protein